MIKSWMVIGGVTILLALLSNYIHPEDLKWFKSLERPKWLFFEVAIPLIWIPIFVSSEWSAIIIWENNPSNLKTWLIMSLYLLLATVTIAYMPITLKLRSLKDGIIIEGTSIILTLMIIKTIWNSAFFAALLLMPLLSWNFIKICISWEMIRLNNRA